MAGMGPAPKPASQRARRNATIATTKLPREGRQGKTPRWPLIPDIETRARRDVWAAKVEALEAELEAAQDAGKDTGRIEARLDRAREQQAVYEARLAEQARMERTLWRDLWRLPQAVQWERLGWTRDVAQYVRHKVLAELGDLDAAREARQWSDRLGLSPLALLRLRWEIDDTEPEQPARPRSRSARYAGLRVVGGALGAEQ